MSKHLHQQIDLLKQRVLFLGTLVEEAIARAVSALFTRDAALAERVIAADTVIDRMEVEIEEECLKILALYQPVAYDLRFVVSVLKINNDLERIGDLGRNIAKRAAYLSNAAPLELPPQLREMAAKAQTMVKNGLDALVNGDAALARQVRLDDDAVDDLRSQIRADMMEHIRKNPTQVELLLKINAVAKHLERIADMATNVAEDVIYLVQGDIVRHRMDDE